MCTDRDEVSEDTKATPPRDPLQSSGSKRPRDAAGDEDMPPEAEVYYCFELCWGVCVKL